MKMFKSTIGKKEKLKPIKKEDLEKLVKYEIEKAVEFMESEISPKRQRAEIYYQGGTALQHIPGRSKVVVSKVRDAIKSVLPSIGRIFTQSDIVCEFQSDDEEDEKICSDATLYCNRIFWRYDGYRAFIEAVTCALKSRIGVIRVGYRKEQVAEQTKTGMLTQEDLDQIDEMEDVTLTEVGEVQSMEDQDGFFHNVREAVITRKVTRDTWEIYCVPPEEFIISAEAVSTQGARLFGLRSMKRIYELTALGIPYQTILDSGLDDEDSSQLAQERVNRLGFDVSEEEVPEDPTSREALHCEIWMQIDADGDGIAEFRRIMTVGNKYTIVVDEPAEYCPLAIFKADLMPNVFFPISLAEDLEQDQDAMTALLRAILDNTALVNSPRTVVNEQAVNLDDAKNNEIGAIIRARQMGQIEELVTPFVAGQTLPVLQALNDISEARSGITKLSQGVDPDALQSTSRVAANAISQAAEARTEMMARNIGETGCKELFMAILRCAIYDKRGPARVKDDKGEQGYREVDTSEWHDHMSVMMNVGLGNGKIEEKQAILAVVAEAQKLAIGQYGLSNPLSGYIQLRNTYKKLLRMSGINNINDYFPYVDPQVLQQMDQAKAEAMKQEKQTQPDPTQAIVEAEKIKGQVKMQVEGAKLQQEGKLKSAELIQKGQIESRQLQTKVAADMQKHMMDMELERSKAIQEDDRQRDKQDQDYAVAAEKVKLDAKTKVQVAKQVAAKRKPA
jgi:hypothetical protein